MKVARARRAPAGAGASCLGWLFGRSDLQWQELFGFGTYTVARWVPTEAAIAQLGERQTEDLKVPGSIPGLGSLLMSLYALLSLAGSGPGATRNKL